MFVSSFRSFDTKGHIYHSQLSYIQSVPEQEPEAVYHIM